MPSSRAILANIEKQGLSPNKPHSNPTLSGQLVKSQPPAGKKEEIKQVEEIAVPVVVEEAVKLVEEIAVIEVETSTQQEKEEPTKKQGKKPAEKKEKG